MTSGKLSNRAALVTGGSRSIGAAIVRKLAADGARVAFTYSASRDQAEQLAQELRNKGGEVIAIKADAGDPAAVQTAVDAAAAHFGQLDILVNNAGIAIGKPVDAVTAEDFGRMIDVNVRGVYVAIQAALRHLGQGGRIVNIGSINSSFVPYAGGSLYVMTKAAVAGLTQALARDLGPRGITINNVQPGPTATDMNPATGAFADSARAYTALGRYADAAEIADFVAYLASPGASYITGASLAVDGGYAA